jgi:hypothetical protein
MSRREWRKAVLVSLGTYVLSYLVLSFNGAYGDNVSILAKIGTPCLCISDMNEWQPLFISAAHLPEGDPLKRKLYTNYLGYLYMPLVVLDQTFWHKTYWLNHP